MSQFKPHSKRPGAAGNHKRTRSNKPKSGLQKHQYLIEHMDSLGQGVCKQEGTVTFIAKTLPDESGVARIHKRSKGVQFAKAETLDQPSAQRVEAECVHFNECPGCHYLHTDYDTELGFKRGALIKIMQPLLRSGQLSETIIEVVAAPDRLAYRNRMQLHYRHKYIGLVDAATDQVIEIPSCKMIRPELQSKFDALYNKKTWTESHQGKGHCELYLDADGVKQTWNSSYADGGFTQVNSAMNAVLKKIVSTEIVSTQMVSKEVANNKSPNRLLDLFSGNGNLSDDALLAGEAVLPRVMVDVADNSHDDYLKIDLFDEGALKRFKRLSEVTQFDSVLLDPPRKGFPALAEWVKLCKPKQLIYVSCNAATMARDLSTLEGKFTIDKLLLVDMFPSTYHFETVACLSFK
ncbi:hypothetical protein N9W57_04975 [Pseudomonadales bacterium]|nr:hypothetical protein [Pseudomonadales bacterium]